jgi:uncharacterized protein DUF5667
MRKKGLIKELHNLKQTIKPDEKWQSSNREILLNQIKAQTRLDFENNKVKAIVKMVPSKFMMALRPVATFAIIIIIVLGVWTASVSATKNSLPGDLFYNIKLTSERVQVNLSLNDEKKANLEIAFAQRRLDEIKKITDDSNDKEKKIEVPLKKFQESMVNVKSNLAKLEKKDLEKAIKIANIIEEKSKEYVGLLEDQQEISPEFALDAENAILASKSTANKALALIIQEYEAGASGWSEEEVVLKVNNKIDSIKNDLNQARDEIDLIVTNMQLEQEKLAAEAEAEAIAVAEAEEAAEAAESTEEEGITADDADTEEEASDESAEEDVPEGDEENDQPAEEEGTTEETTTETEITEEVVAEEEPVEEEPEMTEEPEEVLPTIDEAKARRIEAYTLLTDADNLIKENKISEAFNKIKRADEILTIINKVILNNSEYLLEEEGAGENEDADTGDSEESDSEETAIENTDNQEV